jgi:hypothetical protein
VGLRNRGAVTPAAAIAVNSRRVYLVIITEVWLESTEGGRFPGIAKVARLP